MVEHRNHNPLVGGSNPSPATNFFVLKVFLLYPHLSYLYMLGR